MEWREDDTQTSGLPSDLASCGIQNGLREAQVEEEIINNHEYHIEFDKSVIIVGKESSGYCGSFFYPPYFEMHDLFSWTCCPCCCTIKEETNHGK
jgi:hypothetical protein